MTWIDLVTHGLRCFDIEIGEACAQGAVEMADDYAKGVAVGDDENASACGDVGADVGMPVAEHAAGHIVNALGTWKKAGGDVTVASLIGRMLGAVRG